MNQTRNDDRLSRSEKPDAKGRSERLSKGKSIMTREDAGVDADEPWIASCDLHGQMLACSTKANARAALRDMDFCSQCSQVDK